MKQPTDEEIEQGSLTQEGIESMIALAEYDILKSIRRLEYMTGKKVSEIKLFNIEPILPVSKGNFLASIKINIEPE